MPYTAVGTGTNAPAAGDTALQTELARVANVATSSVNVLQLSATFGPGVATGAVTEAGLFSASSSGTMYARTTSVFKCRGWRHPIVNWSVTFS